MFDRMAREWEMFVRMVDPMLWEAGKARHLWAEPVSDAERPQDVEEWIQDYLVKDDTSVVYRDQMIEHFCKVAGRKMSGKQFIPTFRRLTSYPQEGKNRGRRFFVGWRLENV